MAYRIAAPAPGSLVAFEPRGPGTYVVQVRAPSEAQKRAHLAQSLDDDKARGRERTHEEYLDYRWALIRNWVVSVEGLEDSEGPITTSAAFWERAELLVDCVPVSNFIESLLTLSSEAKKNSPSLPASSSAATTRSSGTAANAELPPSVNGADVLLPEATLTSGTGVQGQA